MDCTPSPPPLPLSLLMPLRRRMAVASAAAESALSASTDRRRGVSTQSRCWWRRRNIRHDYWLVSRLLLPLPLPLPLPLLLLMLLLLLLLPPPPLLLLPPLLRLPPLLLLPPSLPLPLPLSLLLPLLLPLLRLLSPGLLGCYRRCCWKGIELGLTTVNGDDGTPPSPYNQSPSSPLRPIFQVAQVPFHTAAPNWLRGNAPLMQQRRRSGSGGTGGRYRY
mmetsp:Transcript_13760/g.30578  ORF Transcript_13760/g.30578 Transcript_13760/m.30578 type:complete len:219 (-) Transcript_13760:15-671(-)